VQNQILALRVMAAGLAIASALFANPPAAADDQETCTDSLRSDVAIAACTRAIASGQYTTQNVTPSIPAVELRMGPKASTTGPFRISKRRFDSIHNSPSVMGPIPLLLEMADSSFVVVLSFLTAGLNRFGQ
jgi:hypothetical protein